MNKVQKHSDELMSVLNRYDRLLLEDLPEEAQMERFDRKFAFHSAQLPEVLESLTGHYKIVEAVGDVISPYHSRYIDTDDFLFYRQHHSGLRGRGKVRYRTYLKTNTSFLEIKLKSNKGLTSKVRIPVRNTSFPLDDDSLNFLRANNISVDPDHLMVSAHVDYERVAFIASCGTERFSIDLNINASYNGHYADFGNVSILEVKQDHNFTSPVISRLRELGIREETMSKYCLSLSMIEKSIKTNIFKADLRRIKKINEKRFYIE